MSAVRYWRVRSISLAGTYLEISEWQLFNGGARADVSATLSSSSPPETGSLAVLNDGSLSTRTYWSRATATHADFWIRWDLGSPQQVTGMHLGGFDTADRYPTGFAVENSADGNTWVLVTTTSGLVYPGNQSISGLIAVQPPVTYCVAGVAQDTDGTPLPGVTVRIHSRTTGALLASKVTSDGAANSDDEFPNVSLLLHGGGADGSTVFTDSSGDNRTFSVGAGTPTITFAQSKFGGSSIRFPQGSRIQSDAGIPPRLNVGNHGGTIEFFVRFNAYHGPRGVLIGNWVGNVGWTIGINPGGGSFFYTAAHSGTNSPGFTAMALGVWYHLAFVFRGTEASTIDLWIDGVFQSTTARASPGEPGSSRLHIGNRSDNSLPFDGWIDELRISSSVRYLAGQNFGVPDGAYPDDFGDGDDDYANVTALVRGVGIDGAVAFLDESPDPKTITVSGDAQVDTAEKKYGTGSISMTSGYLSIPGTEGEFSFGTGDFTIELWARFTTMGSETGVIWGNGVGWTLFVYPAGKLTWGRTAPQPPANLIYGSATLSTGEWHHIAVTRASGTVTLWVDGVPDGTVSDATNYAPNGNLRIGQAHAGGGGLNGWMDDVRITKGVARYTAPFIVPNEAKPYEQSITLPGHFTVNLGPINPGEVQVVFMDPDGGTLYNDVIHRAIPIEVD